jgi:hypothetical protein
MTIHAPSFATSPLSPFNDLWHVEAVQLLADRLNALDGTSPFRFAFTACLQPMSTDGHISDCQMLNSSFDLLAICPKHDIR